MQGKIAFVRYGGNFRGLKVKAAEDAGAAGERGSCIVARSGTGTPPAIQFQLYSNLLICSIASLRILGVIIYSDPSEDGESESSLVY